MPETPVDEYESAVALKNEIRFAGELFVVQSVPESLPEQCLPDDEFRSSVLSPDASHHSAANFRSDDVCHIRQRV